jgi:hypothetical protein
MTSPRAPSLAFVPRNRLAKILSAMDRKAFSEHVANAEREVERVAPSLGESLDEDVRGLIRLCRQPEAEIFAQCREIGWLALRIVEGARLAGRSQLAEAARGVWEMVEALSERGVWHTDALRLHVDAMQALISTTPIDAEGLAAIERELLKMRAAIGVKSPT